MIRIPCCLLSLLVFGLPSIGRAAEIKLFAAGSLTATINEMIADYRKTTPDVVIVPKFGPAGVLRDRLAKGEAFDIFAPAALDLARSLTQAGIAGPSVLFAHNNLCALALSTAPIETDSLVSTLLDPKIRIGTSTPKSDPGGDYTWQFFRNIEREHKGAYDVLTGKAEQLIGGPTNSAPRPDGRFAPLVALDTHRIDLFILYCSGAGEIAAASSAYKRIDVPAALNVGADYGLTLSRKATPEAAGFAMFILSEKGQAILARHGFSAAVK
jgi:molybdate transport system substrate-binding protein